DARFTGGVSVAATNLVLSDPPVVPGGSGSSLDSGFLIPGPRPGGGAHVRGSVGRTGQPSGPGFFAFDARFTGGVNVAYNPSFGSIIAAAGSGGLPLVRAFTILGGLIQEFLAY